MKKKNIYPFYTSQSRNPDRDWHSASLSAEALQSSGNNITKPSLLGEVSKALRTRHYSLNTEKAYVRWIVTKTVRKSGQAGTGKLKKIYGDDFVCVRYKYDYKNKIRYKTVEIIVDKNPWTPPKTDKYLNKRVYVQILHHELALRKLVKNAGGIWNSKKKLWKVKMKAVWDLHLEDRIIKNRTK